MYNALRDTGNHGSTRCHMDMTAAFNLMTWSGPTAEGEPGYALWHIFAPSDASALRDFLKSYIPPERYDGDPIHSQSIYITSEMLKVLKEKHRVEPFTIKQRVGEIVFIPPGAAHQV